MHALRRGLKDIRQLLLEGGPGFAQFAITSGCNAKCAFCNFANIPRAQWIMVPLDDARRAIDILVGRGIRYLTFVGGEPFLHPDLPAMIEHTSAAGAKPVICTNGSMLTADLVTRLAAGGLRNMLISIDAVDTAVHDANRGLRNLSERIARSTALLKAAGVHVTASVALTRLVPDVAALPEFIRGLGFDDLTFSYPLTTLQSGYLSYSDSALVDFRAEELVDLFQQIIDLKRQDRFILNPTASLEDMIRHVRKEPERFPCLAGYKYFFLDWHLDLYRCHFWKEPMCRIWDFPVTPLIRDGCTLCMIDCYRDPSALQYVAVSVSDAIQALVHGHVGQAVRALADRQNLISLQSVVENAATLKNF